MKDQIFRKVELDTLVLRNGGDGIKAISAAGVESTVSLTELTGLDVTPGTVTASKAVVVDTNKDASAFRNVGVVNLDAGASGTSGSVDIFPSTASKGKVSFTAADSAGDTTTAIVNASQAGARTYTIPDAGASASFVMTEGAQTVNGVKTFGSAPALPAIDASDSSLAINGQSAAQGGAIVLTGGTSSTAGNAGGAVTVTGGTPGATSAGGAVTLAAGIGGATSGAGGVSSLTGGAGTAGNSAGGVSKVVGGAGQGSAAGGAAQATGGVGGATGTGGAAQVAGGAGGATSGVGGAASLTGGAGTAGNSAGGAASVTGGAGQGTANGGAASLTGGASGAGATGDGASATVAGGAAASTNGNGGSVVLTAGAKAGTGLDGIIRANGVFGRKLSRATIANAATISDAETAGGVLYQDASGGNVTMTTRTGTQLAAAFPDLATGEALSIFCASNHGTNTSTIAGGTDVTLVGSGAVINTGGQFLLIKTAATTFDLVRVG